MVKSPSTKLLNFFFFFFAKTLIVVQEIRETLIKFSVAKRSMVLLPRATKFDQISSGQRLGSDFVLIPNVMNQSGSQTGYPKCLEYNKEIHLDDKYIE
jgi:hypothetical protein